MDITPNEDFTGIAAPISDTQTTRLVTLDPWQGEAYCVFGKRGRSPELDLGMAEPSIARPHWRLREGR